MIRSIEGASARLWNITTRERTPDCSNVLMKNWAVALLMMDVRAMAIVPRVFFSPFPASFLIGSCVFFW